MSSIKKFISGLFLITLITGLTDLFAQDDTPWLQDFTEEMQVGTDIYRYKFTNVDGNDCKIKIEKLLTDKKGSTESSSWVFYLSDIDPTAIRYESKRKALEITMESRNSQKFISFFEEGEFEEYTNEIELTMNEVDITRDFIEALRENVDECKESQTELDDLDDAIEFLSTNIGDAVDDDIRWKQNFSAGEKEHIVIIKSESEDEKGEQESFEYKFDLNDINPLAINLEASGKSLRVEVPVREGNNFIELVTNEGKEYTDEMLIYSDDIEVARQIVNALTFVVTNSSTERTEWTSYTESLEFIKENLGELKIDDDTYLNTLEFDADPAGIVNFTIKETDNDGETEEVTYSFYLTDIVEKLTLDVSKNEVSVQLETKNDRDYIRESEGENVSGYESEFEFYVSDIDNARDIINAFEYAIENSEEEIEEFESVNDVNVWLNDNLVTLFREGEKYEQSIMIHQDKGNQIIFDQILTEDEGEVTESKYLLYPQDINLEELEIDVSGGRLTVALITEKDDFIKYFENGKVDEFTDEAEIYFSDPLVAKNFMAAIRFLRENTKVVEEKELSREEALEFLTSGIQNLEFDDEQFEQKLEEVEGGKCKMRFTRVEIDEDGGREEFIYEFIASDIHEGNSEISVDNKVIEVVLKTAGDEEVIKPYENGEVEDFESEFTIFADDVVLGRKILHAFGALSEGCK